MKITIHRQGSTTIQEYLQPVMLSTVFHDASVSADFPCGGKGRCGKCRVRASGALSQPSEQELKFLSPEDLHNGIRLACMTTVLGDAEVHLSDAAPQQILTDGRCAPFSPDQETDGFGLAVDIGTTTVAAYLYPLGRKTPVAVASEKNPQSRFGADVISRIEKSMAGDREELAAVIRQCLGRLIKSLCDQASVGSDEIRRGVITGNTAMLYLLCGEDISSIAAAPFDSRMLWGQWYTASQLDLPLPPQVPCYLPRCISAYVGADITTSILAGGYPSRKPSLLVDIGTNGEMALIQGEELLCCSTAAGPAFEGAGISRGMNAAPGAICRVDCKGDDLVCSVMGDQEPAGICGSGLIDAVAALLQLGVVDETGLILEEDHPLLSRITEENDLPAVRLAGDVLLTQQDIRAVQLAKSAICAGMLTLLKEAGLSPEDLGELVIAGGFGSSIRIENAQAIGLIPQGLLHKTRFIGNGAGAGASMVLLSEAERERSFALATRARTVELASNPVFSNFYMDNMLFPL